MVRKLNRKERRLIIRIIRVLLFSFLGLIILLLLITGYLYIDRDNISRRLLLSTNNYTQGELKFESIAFNPFVQFPSISMLVRNVEFHENPLNDRNQNEKPLAKFEKVYATLDVSRLIQGHLEVSEIKLTRGEFNLIQYPDSTLNLLNAIRIQGSPGGEKRLEQTDSLALEVSIVNLPEASDSTGQSELKINLEKVLLEDISFIYDNRLEGNLAELDFKALNASLEYTPEAIRSRLETDIEIESVQLSNIKRMGHSDLYLETAFEFLREELSLVLDPSILVFDDAKLNIGGELNFKDKGSVNLDIDGSDHDFTFLQLIFSETGLKNLEEGDMYIRGTVKNNSLKGLPVVDLSFGLDNVRMFVPKAQDYISNLNLKGRLNTGRKTDLSSARLRIDTLYALLPDGYVNAALSIKNFRVPEIDVLWDMKADLSGLDQVFNFGFLDSLQGSFESSIIIRNAIFNPDSGLMDTEFFEANLVFDSASVAFPGIMSINLLDGRIHHNEKTTHFHNLKALIGDTDFFINGKINNSMYIPFQVDTIITADLKVQSEVFDLPGFLDFVPVFPEAFPFRILDVDLDVSITTSTKRFLDMSPNPSMTFEINHLDAEIENLLPHATIDHGVFELHHKNERVDLDFQEFEIGILGADLVADLQLHSPALRQTYIEMAIDVDGLNPSLFIWDEESDTIPEFLNGILSGSFLLDLHFPHDTLQTLKKIDLRQADLHFVNASDPIETESLNILAEDIYMDPEKDPNPFGSLTADITMDARKSRFNSFSWFGCDFTIEAREGSPGFLERRVQVYMCLILSQRYPATKLTTRLISMR